MNDLHRKCPCGSGKKARWCCEQEVPHNFIANALKKHGYDPLTTPQYLTSGINLTDDSIVLRVEGETDFAEFQFSRQNLLSIPPLTEEKRKLAVNGIGLILDNDYLDKHPEQRDTIGDIVGQYLVSSKSWNMMKSHTKMNAWTFFVGRQTAFTPGVQYVGFGFACFNLPVNGPSPPVLSREWAEVVYSVYADPSAQSVFNNLCNDSKMRQNWQYLLNGGGKG